MNLREYQEWLEQKAEKIKEAKHKTLLDAGMHAVFHVQHKAIPEAKPYPPINSGHYKASWKWWDGGDENTILVGTDSPYRPELEYGSRPHFPPLSPIALWAQRKFGLSPEDAKKAAFAIARKIAKVGTKPRYINLGSQNEFQKILNQSVKEHLSLA